MKINKEFFKTRVFYLLITWVLIIIYTIWHIYDGRIRYLFFSDWMLVNSYMFYAILLVILTGCAILWGNRVVRFTFVITILFYTLIVMSEGLYRKKIDIQKLAIMYILLNILFLIIIGVYNKKLTGKMVLNSILSTSSALLISYCLEAFAALPTQFMAGGIFESTESPIGSIFLGILLIGIAIIIFFGVVYKDDKENG